MSPLIIRLTHEPWDTYRPWPHPNPESGDDARLQDAVAWAEPAKGIVHVRRGWQYVPWFGPILIAHEIDHIIDAEFTTRTHHSNSHHCGRQATPETWRHLTTKRTLALRLIAYGKVDTENPGAPFPIEPT